MQNLASPDRYGLVTCGENPIYRACAGFLGAGLSLMFMSIAYAIKLHTTNRGLLILVVALDAISMAFAWGGKRMGLEFELKPDNPVGARLSPLQPVADALGVAAKYMSVTSFFADLKDVINGGGQ